jgi:hypothetical protein
MRLIKISKLERILDITETVDQAIDLVLAEEAERHDFID